MSNKVNSDELANRGRLIAKLLFGINAHQQRRELLVIKRIYPVLHAVVKSALRDMSDRSDS